MRATDKPLRPGEAAALLGVHRSTIYRLAQSGRLPFFTLPTGKLRFAREDVLACLAPGRPRKAPAVESKREAVARRRETALTLKEFGL